MRIGIITVHYNLNYGAALQTYALQNALMKLGYEVDIINYVNPLAKKSVKIFGGGVVEKARALLFLGKRIKRKKAFMQFIRHDLNLSGEMLEDSEQINAERLPYDLYITGSDQTFNLHLAGGGKYRGTYFLPLIKNNKISYAASMGDTISNYCDEEKRWLIEHLRQYKVLSVREEAAADFIAGLGLERPHVDVDPTLLLDCDAWSSFATETKYTPGSYILFYSVLSAPWIVRNVERIAKQTGLPVIAPHLQNRFEVRSGFIRAEECGPREFVSLVKNAAMVCTSSFHGTVFSIQFKKKFLAFSVTEHGRIANILKKLLLEKRLVTEKDDVISRVEKLDELDFAQTDTILQEERKKSMEYILSAVEKLKVD